jgi:hypothetical protein
VEGTYLRVTADTVTIRLPNLQNQMIKLSDLSAEDRTFVETQLAAEKEAKMIEGVMKGEISWRLGSWSSLSWSSAQSAEIYLWDEATKQPGAKLADVAVDYKRVSARNEFAGKYQTEKSVRLPKDAKVVVKTAFRFSVNREEKNLTDISVPCALPQLAGGEFKLPTVRASAR